MRLVAHIVGLGDTVGGFGLGSGRLEIYLNGGWGTVCRNGFGLTEARVACRQLGYPPREGIIIGTLDTATLG